MSGDTFSLDAGLAPQTLAQQIVNLYQSWNGMRQVARARWKETTQYVFATSTKETGNAQNGWSHSTHIPKITQIHDNLIANYAASLFPHEDWLRFVGMDRDASDLSKRKAVEAYITNKHTENGFENVVLNLLNDWTLYGNCFAMVWYAKEFTKDADTGEILWGYEGPKVGRISPYDIVFNPMATDFACATKIIRSIKTMAEIEKEIEENPESSFYTNILPYMKDIRAQIASSTQSEVDKSIQIQFDGFGSAWTYFMSGYVEVFELYGDVYDVESKQVLKNHVITVCDGRWVLRNQPVSNWSGRPHIFHCGWRLRPDNLWAMGPLDNLVGMQYHINHLENARSDAFDQMLFPTRVLVGDVDKAGVVAGQPGGEYIIPTGEGSVTNLVPDTTVLNADNQIALKEKQMEEFAGAPREAAGFRTPGEKTAFEVESLQNSASRIFENKIKYFESNFLEKIINAEMETARRNLDKTVSVRVIDDDFGVSQFLAVTKEDIQAKGILVARGARHFAREAQQAQNMLQFSQALQIDPDLALHFPADRMAKEWENILRLDKFGLYQRFGRLLERAEAQSVANEAAQAIQEQNQAGLPPNQVPQ